MLRVAPFQNAGQPNGITDMVQYQCIRSPV